MSRKPLTRKKGDCLYCHTPVPEEQVQCNTCDFPHRGPIKHKVRFSKQLHAKQGDYTMYSACKVITGVGFLLYSLYYLDIFFFVYYEDNILFDLFLLSLASLTISSLTVFFFQKIGAITLIISFVINLILGSIAFGSDYLQYDVATRGILIFTLAITLFRVNHHLELKKYLQVIKRKSDKSTAIEAYSRTFSSFL